MTPEHIRAQRYRERRASKLARANAMEAALRKIGEIVKDKTSEAAQQIRKAVEEGLRS